MVPSSKINNCVNKLEQTTRARLTFSPPPPFFDLRRGSKTRARASRLLNKQAIEIIDLKPVIMTHMTRIYEYLPLTSYELGVRIGLRKMQKKCCRWAGGREAGGGGGARGGGAAAGAGVSPVALPGH